MGNGQWTMDNGECREENVGRDAPGAPLAIENGEWRIENLQKPQVCHPELAKELNALQYRRLEILRELRMTLRVVNRCTQMTITIKNKN